jgi:hypothetical protein
LVLDASKTIFTSGKIGKLHVIIEIRSIDMVFKFKNLFDPPFSRLKLFWPPQFIWVKLRLPRPPFTPPPPPPINNDHSLIIEQVSEGGPLGMQAGANFHIKSFLAFFERAIPKTKVKS